ncbi:MAG: HEAT repeat domain-containing protein [Candidatus Wallbacteria bacterium]|nr:HEAT repeat domain-containing protein [Candidatus Wallbacteria bacterium]
MRYQDRLLSLLPAKHPQVARYVCRELEGLFPHFDSERIVGALDAEAAATDPAACLQAAVSAHRYLNTHLEALYAPESWPAGPRLSRSMDLANLEARRELAPGGPRSDTLPRSAVHLLDSVITALVGVIPRVQTSGRQRAFRTLAHLPHGAAADIARKTLVKEGAEAGPLALLALAANCRAGKEEELTKLAGHLDGTWLYPAAIESLALAPYDAVHQFLVRQASRATADTAPSFAAAFESFGAFGVLKPLASLAARGSGWTTLQVLQSLGRLRNEKALDTIETIFWRQDLPSVREAAVRAAGAIRAEASAGFLRTALAGELPPTVAARALQSLQTVGGEPEALARLAAPHLHSSDPELSVSAVLASLVGDEAASVKAIRSLTRSREPFQRAQGAYCLGYFQGRPSLQVLGYLAKKDADPGVRRQAVASLAGYETTPTLREILLELLREPDLATLPVLASVLGRADISEDAGAADALVAAAEQLAGKAEARRLYAPLGRIDNRTASNYLADRLRGKQDPEELLALLEAIDLRGTTALGAVHEAARHSDPRVRAAAAVLLWNQGDAGGTDILRELLADTTARESFQAALEAMDRIAVTGIKLAEYPRFRILAAKLRENVEAPLYQDFASSELSLSVPLERLAMAYDPNVKLAERVGWRELDDAGLGQASTDPLAVSAVGRPSRIARSAAPPTFAMDGMDAPGTDPRVVRFFVWVAGAIAAAVMLIAVLGVVRLSVAALSGPVSRIHAPPAGSP